MRSHSLKCWPRYFERLRSGEKKFEFRKNDRDFQVGDQLVLNEWTDPAGPFTGRWARYRVTYVLTDVDGLASGWCVLSLDLDTWGPQ